MLDIYELLQRQARWQRGRTRLSWPEKLRMVEAIQESVKQLRAGGAQTNRSKRIEDRARDKETSSSG
jgi:hypothetical protein